MIEQLCGILDDCPIDNPYVTKAAAVLRFWFDKQDSRDEQGSLNERSKPGVGNERNTWGIQSKWSKPGVGEGERNKQSKL
ncbi:MAG: hypothetical protein WAP46_01985 [Dysgonamonadaceae bacterium]